MADAHLDLAKLLRIEEVRRRIAEAALVQAQTEREARERESNAAADSVEETLAYWSLCLQQRGLDQHLLAGLTAELNTRDELLARAAQQLTAAQGRVTIQHGVHAEHRARLKSMGRVLRRLKTKKAKKKEDERERALADLMAARRARR